MSPYKRPQDRTSEEKNESARAYKVPKKSCGDCAHYDKQTRTCHERLLYLGYAVGFPRVLMTDWCSKYIKEILDGAE